MQEQCPTENKVLRNKSLFSPGLHFGPVHEDVFTFDCLYIYCSLKLKQSFFRVQVSGFLTQMLFGFQPYSFRTTVLGRNIYCYSSLMERLDIQDQYIVQKSV